MEETFGIEADESCSYLHFDASLLEQATKLPEYLTEISEDAISSAFVWHSTWL